MTGTAKDSATEPEYNLVWKMNCRRILGGFFVEAHSTWAGKGRVVNVLEVLYYDPVRKIHAYSGFDSGGTTWVATVKFGDGTFTETETDTGPDGKITTVRNTWTLSPDRMSISGRQEAEQDGVRWTSFTVKGTKTYSGSAQGTEEGYLTGSDGNRLFYRKLGSGEPTLVYLHGGPINMNDGGYEIDRLGREHTLIMIDQRSGGRSELVQDKERLVYSRYVEDVEAVRVHFGLQKMLLAGQSFGARVAASYAYKHPDRVERLMLWSPGPPTSTFATARGIATNQFLGEANAKRVDEIWSRMASGPDSEVVPLCREWLRIYFRFYVVDPDALSRMKGDYCAGTPATIRHQNRAMDIIDEGDAVYDIRPELRTLHIPTLVIEGAETRVPLDATEEWARVMSDARLILIPGASHLVWLEGGDAFFEAVEQFMAGDWPKTARILHQ